MYAFGSVFLLVQLPITLVAALARGLVFYVQHQF